MTEPDAGIVTLYSSEQIAARVAELAGEIARRLDRDLLVVAILKGSFVFAADLLRALHGAGVAPEVDFMFLGSYGADTVSSGEVRLLRDVESEIAGREVLLIDDILESGRTLDYARQSLVARGAARVLTCVLLDKRTTRAAQIEADFSGFACAADAFVVGYGMDLAHRYRELPYIGRPVG